LPSAQEERDEMIRRAYNFIITQYGGDVQAYFNHYFASEAAKRDKAESEKWSAIQGQLLQRLATASR